MDEDSFGWSDSQCRRRRSGPRDVGDFDNFVFAFEHGGNPDAFVVPQSASWMISPVTRHELARHVAGVGSLERRVRRPLRAPCVEMKYSRRTDFAEVRQNRLLNNFAAGLGHEARKPAS